MGHRPAQQRIVAQAFAALVTGARLVISGPPFAPAGYVDTIGRRTIGSVLLAGERPRTITVKPVDLATFPK
jgi:hypothetical protein